MKSKLPPPPPPPPQASSADVQPSLQDSIEEEKKRLRQAVNTRNTSLTSVFASQFNAGNKGL